MPDRFADHERSFMQRALALAKRGQGRVEPNPMVGCVIAKGRRTIAEGYHRRFGGPHAEVEALRRASAKAKGATAYVTLEPCCHFGKTPPCTQALLEAGVARVIAAMRDPFPRVAGGGFRQLRVAGVAVDVGLGGNDAAELNAPYLTLIGRERPYVILKWAQSLDGKIATRTGDSQWISSPQSRRRVHRLRARVDAVVVGIGTVLADDPLLTARDVPLRRTAARVVLDTHLRLRQKCQLVVTADQAPLIVMTSRKALAGKKALVEKLSERGVTVEPCRLRGTHLDLADVLARLGQRRMTNVLVEGGGQILAGLLDNELADEAHVFVAPKLLGGTDAVSAYPGLGARTVGEAKQPHAVRITPSGPDLYAALRLTAPIAPSKL